MSAVKNLQVDNLRKKHLIDHFVFVQFSEFVTLNLQPSFKVFFKNTFTKTNTIETVAEPGAKASQTHTRNLSRKLITNPGAFR